MVAYHWVELYLKLLAVAVNHCLAALGYQLLILGMYGYKGRHLGKYPLHGIH